MATALMVLPYMGVSTSSAVEIRSGDTAPNAESSRSDDTDLSRVVVEGLLRLREQGPTLFPDVYGGIASGHDGADDVLVVYLTDLNPSIEAKIRELADVPAAKVRFERAAMSRVAAEALDARFSADSTTLQNEGFPLRSWGIGRDLVYEIEMSSLSGQADDAYAGLVDDLNRRYGPNLRVTNPKAEAQLASRVDDHVQWFGGNFITTTRVQFGQTSYPYCTNSFALTNPAGNKFVLTAGHCFATGEKVYNGIPPSYRIGGWNSNLIGSLYTRTYNTGYPDAGLISADGSRGIWTGSSASPSGTVTVGALVNPWSGMPLCMSGAYEGEVCSLKVGNPDHTQCVIAGPCFAHQATADSSNAQTIGPGDSGAPLYVQIDGFTYGVGTASSQTGQLSAACINWSAWGRGCSSGVHFQNIGPVMSQWGLSLDP